jgi:branched-chain amino acid transport system ATP-binding protein
MLRIENLSAGYGGMNVLHGVSFDIAPGEIVALLGCNGAGKTTLVKSMMGLLPATTGSIELFGTPLAGRRTHDIARLGMGLVPQGRWVFPRLTVRENLETGTQAAGGAPVFAQVFDYFPVLAERLNQQAGTLSGGEQQVLAIARALCGRPKVLLLDEPSDGVQPSIIELIGDVIPTLCQRLQLAVLLVEQNLDLVLRTASRCVVLESGRVVHAGPVEAADPQAPVHPLARYLSPAVATESPGPGAAVAAGTFTDPRMDPAQ